MFWTGDMLPGVEYYGRSLGSSLAPESLPASIRAELRCFRSQIKAQNHTKWLRLGGICECPLVQLPCLSRLVMNKLPKTMFLWPLSMSMDGDSTISQATMEKLLPFGSVISCVTALRRDGAKQRGKVLPSVTSPEGGLQQRGCLCGFPTSATRSPHSLVNLTAGSSCASCGATSYGRAGEVPSHAHATLGMTSSLCSEPGQGVDGGTSMS